MKNACTLLVVGSLFLAAEAGRSQDTGMIEGPIVSDTPSGDLGVPTPTPAKCMTLQQRMQEWGKLRTVSQTVVEPAVREPAGPAPSVVSGPAPSPAAVQGFVPVLQVGPCMSGPAHRSCREQLCDWLTYRPLSREQSPIWTPSRGLLFWRDECWQACHSCCHCLPKCAPCCPPPLYTFFIGPCCVNPAGAGCGPACGHCGASFRLWTPSRGLLFWRD
jgi:hypothetical protein